VRDFRVADAVSEGAQFVNIKVELIGDDVGLGVKIDEAKAFSAYRVGGVARRAVEQCDPIRIGRLLSVDHSRRLASRSLSDLGSDNDRDQ